MQRLSLKANLLQQFVNKLKSVLKGSQIKEALELLKLANTLLEQQKEIDDLKERVERLEAAHKTLSKRSKN